ncbi:MAG: hypothetical protein M1515_05255 [Candidatus Thermoplasmatota archaeon]|jgi:ZIP family zinc transporter|nr:hypothetical protein [Candidatus Thermoplasmatota archaeon]
MNDFFTFLALTFAMGLSIFIAMPIVYLRFSFQKLTFLTSVAIGILFFLMADIFGDIMPILYSANSYVAGWKSFAVFVASFMLVFLALFYVEGRPRMKLSGAAGNARTTALIIAIGIALQNVTEGLVFGANWTAGAIGLATVVFVGFFFQNITEGFPIASPLLGSNEKSIPAVASLFFLGGVPTIIGGVIGYHWSNSLFILAFDSLAIGAITYVIIPMLRGVFRPVKSPSLDYQKTRIIYVGIMTGFLLGFAVNAI